MQEQERNSTGFTVAKFFFAFGLVVAAGAAVYHSIPEAEKTTDPSTDAYTQCAHTMWAAKELPMPTELVWALLRSCTDVICPKTILTEACSRFFGSFFSEDAHAAIDALVDQASSLNECFPEPFKLTR